MYRHDLGLDAAPSSPVHFREPGRLIEPGAAGPAFSGEPHLPALEHLGERLLHLNATLGETANRLGQLGDRLFGPQPELGRKSDGSRPTPASGQIDSLHELISELEHRAAQALDRAQTLNARL